MTEAGIVLVSVGLAKVYCALEYREFCQRIDVGRVDFNLTPEHQGTNCTL